ncbi:MAG: hypothetical protein ABSG56_38510, partial [Bryobacteraceae bacterium]
PAVRRHARRRADGDGRGAEGTASVIGAATGVSAPSSTNVGERQLHRDADAQPARAWRRCAGR